MQKAFYYLVFAILTLLSLMPLKVHYLFSDILWFFLYKVFRYRVSVVYINISKSFPEATYAQIKELVSEFYHRFTDIIVETVWAYTSSSKKVAKLLNFGGCEVLNEAYSSGKNVMVVLGHQGNWELYTSLPNLREQYGLNIDNEHFIYIYKRMSNRLSDKIIYRLRDRHHSCSLVEMHSIVRNMLKSNWNGGVYYFIADQAPGDGSEGYHTTFLNQPVRMITGPEAISRRLCLPVLFFDINRVKRGLYQSSYIKICDDASQTPKGFVTQEYTRLLEESIKRDKAGWLWSHKKWKK